MSPPCGSRLAPRLLLALPLASLIACGPPGRMYAELPLEESPLTVALSTSTLQASVTPSGPGALAPAASGLSSGDVSPSLSVSGEVFAPGASMSVLGESSAPIPSLASSEFVAAPSGCGDAQLDANEECDNGPNNSDVAPDACRSDCTRARCGDTVRDNNEECDDGNAADEDECSNLCKLAKCGDKILQGEEACDDGNGIDNDGCTNACGLPRCGDHIVQAEEACDDGNTVNDDDCSNNCTVPGCGDSITQMPLEECDDGASTDNCTAACKRPKCGDSFLQSEEECDDGNTVNNDACTAICTRAKCGDGILSAGESCEDGNKNDGDGCSSTCQAEVCGDGHESGIEQCDDGNKVDNDGCSAACRTEVCGDGVVQSPREDCEDLNTVDTDVCRNGCKNAATLKALSSSCSNVDQITQTVCMVAVANWCKQYNNTPIAGLVTGQKADNEYTVGCISGFQQRDVSTSQLDQCQSGRQQSPACLEQVNAACGDIGFTSGFYLGSGSSSNTFALACGTGSAVTKSVSSCNGIADTSPVPVACAKALATECGSGKGGIIQERAQSNQVTFMCVDLTLTGSVRQL